METVISKIRCAVYKPRTRAGVTLIEMLMVVAVVTLLATIVIGTATHIQNQGNEQVTANIFELLDGALQEYYDYTGSFPETADPDPSVNSEFLWVELNRIPSSRKILGKISDSLIKNEFGATDTSEIYDPWGTVVDYKYELDIDTFPRLESAGPDKSFVKDEDNITNR
jgi:prepilin-type N-terminal cleavage/methylation domain-containing protein